MGQQQLLLIVLGIIIVGIAVVVGINVFTASSSQTNRDAVISDMTNLASMAQQYYRKPTSLGGGGNAFTNWELPPALDTTGNGNYELTITNADEIKLIGYGNEIGNDGTHNVQATMLVGPNSIKSTTIDY